MDERCIGELCGRQPNRDGLVPKPWNAHRLPYERADGGRIWPASHGHQVDLAPEFRIHQRDPADAGVVYGMGRMKAQPSPAATIACVQSSRSLQYTALHLTF
jgi:hypothetical protein